jgi:hypothetical protein
VVLKRFRNSGKITLRVFTVLANGLEAVDPWGTRVRLVRV